MQATTIGQRIKQKRKELHLTQADLAKRVQGVSHAAISQWETDITKPNAENLYDLSQIFKCDFVWLLRGEGENITPHKIENVTKIPVFRYDDLKNWDSTRIINHTETEYIMSEINHSEFAVAFNIIDDSMTPDFLVGDLIVIDPKVRPLPGEFVLARSGETTLFRKFKASELDLGNEQSFSLIPLNDDYASLSSSNHEIEIIGTMVEHRIYRRKR